VGEGKRPLRVVLDTNVLVSALLFKRKLAGLMEEWKRGRFILLFSRETFDEFLKVLSYPKFELFSEEIKGITELEVLPYAEVVEATEGSFGCRDPEDGKFLSCVLSGGADFLVTGDEDLLILREEISDVRIVSPGNFLNVMKERI